MSNIDIENSHHFLSSLGFLDPPFYHECKNIEEVVDVCMNQNIKNKLDAMDVEFDGLVIKVKDNNIRGLLGSTNHHPKRAIAYKYPAKQTTSTVLDIERQVGRSGILTPVAHIEPVQLSGVTIARVTLHNPDFIREKDIRIGDRVFVQRSGEVIPYIVCSVPELRDGSQVILQAPTTCPVCADRVHVDIADSGNTSYYCLNAKCPASTKEKIKHFVSRDMMNIEGIGDAIIEAMVDNQIISNYSDLYKLISDPSTRMVVKNLPGMGDKKIDIIIKGLEQSKTKELYKIIYALGIPQVGEKTAKILNDNIQNQFKIQNSKFKMSVFGYTNLIAYLSDQPFLDQIHSIGPETSSSIQDRVKNEHNKELLSLLSASGVDFSNFGSEIIRDSEKLQYLRFAISGTFQIPREQIISLLVKQGASFCPNITKNTNLLIIGNSPSSKVTKAAKQGIEVIEGLEELEKKLDVDFGLSNTALF